ncbi:MAG: amino-acid N-acetyltransferase [Gammaproteobacteria bacterium]
MNDKESKAAKSSTMVDLFRSSTAYINAHRGKIFVVFLSGEALAHENLANVVYDLTLLHSLGVKLVLVYGSRPQISAALAKRNITSEYHNNLRVTTTESIDSIKQEVGKLGIELEALFSLGTSKSPMHGADIRIVRGNFVNARPVGVHDGIDFHFTGKVRRVQTAIIEQQLNLNNIVLLSNLGYSVTGEVYNLSAEELATEVAIALKSEKLILMIPGTGVTDPEGKLITALSESDAEYHLDRLASEADEESQATCHALQAALQAYKANVHRCHLISYKENGALLEELFTREGHGSLLSSDSFHVLRKATLSDVTGIMALIKPLEDDGTLVPRSLELLENEIENFMVGELEEVVIACAALYPINNSYAEIACIAIHPDYRKNGYGERLLASLQTEARNAGFEKVLVLTTVTQHWFLEHGFDEVSIEELPAEKQALYNLQRKSKVLVKTLA